MSCQGCSKCNLTGFVETQSKCLKDVMAKAVYATRSLMDGQRKMRVVRHVSCHPCGGKGQLVTRTPCTGETSPVRLV